MISTRVIPVLLLRNKGLVKTTKFSEPKYVGDPTNAVKIFNEKEVDELIFLDIMASKEDRAPDFELIESIASEAFMPLGYGGGVTKMEYAERLFRIGIEKVIINTPALKDTSLITKLSDRYGASSIVAAIDIKKSFLGSKSIYNHATGKTTKQDPISTAKAYESAGAGELFVNFVDKDGTMSGFDINTLKSISSSVSIPVVGCGGAKDIDDLEEAAKKCHLSGVAAGSMFVFYGKHKAVLITYPERAELDKRFKI